jgi:hypothetical protein
MNQQLLAPFFAQRPNRLVKDLPFEDYVKIPATNFSILKESTTLEMPELLRLLELRGGGAADAFEMLEQEELRPVPRNFYRSPEDAATPKKPSDPQKRLLEALAAGEVDGRQFSAATIKKAVTDGWAEVFVKEVMEKGVSEDMLASRAEALTLGTVCHMAVLEPHRFHSEVFFKEWQLCPTKSLVSQAAQDALAADPTRRLVTSEIVEKARWMAAAVWKHKLAAEILSLPGQSEATIEIWDSELQLMRKCRIDRLPDDQGAGFIDLKKTRTGLSDGELRGAIRGRQYQGQQAMYLDTLAMMEKKQRPAVYMLFVTDRPPYIARMRDINELDPEKSLICDGRQLYLDRLAMWALAWHEENWEAYENEGAPMLTNGRSAGV